MRSYKLPPIERAFTVLDLIAAAPAGLSLSEITELAGFPKTTAFVVVSALRDQGALRLEGTQYFLGPKLAELGGKAVQRLDVRAVAMPHMQKLSEQTGFTVHLGVLEGTQVVFVEKVEGGGFIRFGTYVGLSQPFHLSSLGKAIAAHLPQDKLEEMLRVPFIRRTRYTTTDPVAFQDMLAAVRQQGFAVEDEENEEGVRCIGAPIFDGSGIVAAISITAVRSQLPAESFTPVGAFVVQAANGISAELGGVGQAASSGAEAAASGG